MHALVGLGHSMMHAVVGSCRDETRTSEHIGISPSEKGWTVANVEVHYRFVQEARCKGTSTAANAA
jgi:hypothetical protein